MARVSVCLCCRPGLQAAQRSRDESVGFAEARLQAAQQQAAQHEAEAAAALAALQGEAAEARASLESAKAQVQGLLEERSRGVKQMAGMAEQLQALRRELRPKVRQRLLLTAK